MPIAASTPVVLQNQWFQINHVLTCTPVQRHCYWITFILHPHPPQLHFAKPHGWPDEQAQLKLGRAEQQQHWQVIKGSDELLLKAVQAYEQNFPMSIPGKFRGHFDFVAFQEEHFKQSSKVSDMQKRRMTQRQWTMWCASVDGGHAERIHVLSVGEWDRPRRLLVGWN
jgi:hypothetical protein